MKVGDYVRTKKRTLQPPQIAIIKSMKKDSGYHNLYYIELDHNLIPYYNFHIYTDDIDKSSLNIVDLIKKKDIVIDYNDNIYQVVKVWKGYVFTDKKNEYGQVITLVDYQIKFIVTHEQFDEIKYEVK